MDSNMSRVKKWEWFSSHYKFQAVCPELLNSSSKFTRNIINILIEIRSNIRNIK